ncbi:uncharacterized protein LOC143469501 isoform X5 [Clavelina lepadiformis]|uniref:uncharacterized protein LOC143469501 isoform X5 n=1 Tax=Clavelina lepadiformis TaxID=159417 RepID=UPI004041161B
MEEKRSRRKKLPISVNNSTSFSICFRLSLRRSYAIIGSEFCSSYNLFNIRACKISRSYCGIYFSPSRERAHRQVGNKYRLCASPPDQHL